MIDNDQFMAKLHELVDEFPDVELTLPRGRQAKVPAQPSALIDHTAGPSQKKRKGS